MSAKRYNFKALIRSAARRIWMWSPMRKEAVELARIPGMKPFHVGCAQCGLKMKESTKPPLHRVDHILPSSEPAALIHDWNNYFDRLNIPAKQGLQVLCEPCHDIKTLAENATRVRKTTKAKRAKRPTKRRKH